jgi:hypothetical protein
MHLAPAPVERYIDLHNSVDELRETISANRRLRAELRQLKSRAFSSSCTAEKNLHDQPKSPQPFQWWICKEAEK